MAELTGAAGGPRPATLQHNQPAPSGPAPRTGKAPHSSLTQLPAAPGAGGRLSFVTFTGASPREAPCPGRSPLPLSVLGSPSARRLPLPQPGDAPLPGAEGAGGAPRPGRWQARCWRCPSLRPVPQEHGVQECSPMTPFKGTAQTGVERPARNA